MRKHYYGAPGHLTRPVRVEPAASSAQARCDEIQAEFRTVDENERPSIRRDPPPRPPDIPATEDQLSLRLGDELDYVRRMVERMGDELTHDIHVVGRHALALQSIDIVNQVLGHLATIVRSSDPEASIDRIGMCELKARLQRRGGI